MNKVISWKKLQLIITWLAAVSVDESGYVYSRSLDDTVIKIHSEREEQWTFEGHTRGLRALAVDSGDYVYSGSVGFFNNDNTVRKISPQGEKEWVYAVAVDSCGYVYSGSSDNTLRKISPNGSELWRFEGDSSSLWDVAADSDGYVYSGSVD